MLERKWLFFNPLAMFTQMIHCSGLLSGFIGHAYPEQLSFQCLARGQSDRTFGCRWTKLLQGFCYLSVCVTSPRLLGSPLSFYRRGWWREWWGTEEGLEEDEGEHGDMEAREAVAAASSASSRSPPPAWSSWLTLDCKAAGVNHSLGRQLCRNGTQELK